MMKRDASVVTAAHADVAEKRRVLLQSKLDWWFEKRQFVFVSGNPEGKRIIIISGEHAGEEGTCLGRTSDGVHWAVSPNNDEQIFELEFDREFGVVVDAS